MRNASSDRLRTIAGLSALLITASSCTPMLQTNLLDPASPVNCKNAAGAYFLPKKLVQVTVQGEDTSGGKSRGFGLDVNNVLNSVPDRNEGYCLDYLGSVTSRDEIGIVRSSEGLLERVYTRAEDKSVEIAKTLIDTSFLLAGGLSREGVGATTTTLAKYEFDPFDPHEAAKMNAGLRPYGFCVFVEGYSFPYGFPARTWCEQPRVIEVFVAKAPALNDALPPVETSRGGVLYRPNIRHTLTVMRKADPYGRDPWLLTMTRQIEVPNRAPAFVVQVSRSLFVDRVTDLEFRDGVLTNISVKKPSEAAAFVEIPLAIASAAVALPGLIVKLKINDANNQKNLIEAQTALISLRQQQNADVAALVQRYGPNSLPGITTPPRTLNGQPAVLNENTHAIFIQNCLATGSSPDVCAQKWLDIAN